MHPFIHAAAQPLKPALIESFSGEVITYSALEDRSNQIAQFFRALGLREGDSIAILLENTARYFEIAWAAQRAGLYFACLSTKLSASEAAYIVSDSNSRILIASAATSDLAVQAALTLSGVSLYMTGEPTPPFLSFDAHVSGFPSSRIDDERNGQAFLYSSGTTGKPKGIKNERLAGRLDQPNGLTRLGLDLYRMHESMVYLCPSPLYHAAPMRWSMVIQQLGGTVILMDRFDAEESLRLISQYRITHAQFVPTHFIRMLKLPAEVRARYDISSLETVFHAAAPCPVPVKQQMIEWWGPIIHEYYAGTESNGFTAIDSDEWLSHPGSVGKSMWGEVKICDDDDHVLPARTEGNIFFANGPKFEYHNDPQKTLQATNRHGWTTLGDVGWLDEEGYLYLTDRKTFMIISGGVNIYPQEIENLLITHPEVADVAVVGAPDPDMGEKVVAVVQPANWAAAGKDLGDRLIAYARAHISHVKVPRQIDFIETLPRLPTGKLPKKAIRDSYWKI